jgi:hypothetical protein
MDDGSYAMRFQDYTWGHTDSDPNEHCAYRREIVDIARNYDQMIKAITEPTDIEQAGAIQAATDLLVENLASHLRAESHERSELVTRVRESYAGVFKLLLGVTTQQQKDVERLRVAKERLEEAAAKDSLAWGARITNMQDEHDQRMKALQKELEDRKQEYDLSLARFMEQKAQLEEHVKALHRVFMDFHTDSVYITLEELKQEQASLQKKLRGKEAEISRLQLQIQAYQKHIQQSVEAHEALEQSNDELRMKLRAAMARTNRLQRQLDIRQMDDRGDEEAIDLSDEEHGSSTLDLGPAKPLISSEVVMASTFGRGGKRARGSPVFDPGPFLQLFQKLSHVEDQLGEVLQHAKTGLPKPFLNEAADELGRAIMLGDMRFVVSVIDSKVDNLTKYASALEGASVDGAGAGGPKVPRDVPRFVRFIGEHVNEVNTQKTVGASIVQTIRTLFQAKRMSDSLRQRMGRQVMRFPEFVIAWHSKDGDTLFTVLQRCTRLYKAVQNSRVPEMRLFRKCLLEKFTVDELSFFLELRESLIDTTPTGNTSPIVIQYKDCRSAMEKLLGQFSPILQIVSGEAEKFVDHGTIDYATFGLVIMRFYRNERRKRRSAARLMFQSQRFAGAQDTLDFEHFVAMVQALGSQGSVDDMCDLFRETVLLGGGEVSLDALLMAMDNLSFHFYVISVPFQLAKPFESVRMPRAQLVSHWTTFSSWFQGFNEVKDQLDGWLVAKITRQVSYVDKLFQARGPVPDLFHEYRRLLDTFQFMLQAMAQGRHKTLAAAKAERELKLLENLIDLLVVFVVDQPEDHITFTEFE